MTEELAQPTGHDAAAAVGQDTAVSWVAARAANHDLWQDRAVLHEDLYGAHALAADPTALSTVVRDDLPVLVQHLEEVDPRLPLAGLDVLHLQCHIGTDTLSLARLGARVVGLDFSAAALEVGARLADEAGLEIGWVESDVLSARDAVDGQFDVVYTSIGTIIWLSDLDLWAHQIAALLRPGGVFYMRDGHPLLLSLDETARTPTVGYRYFANGQAQTWGDGTTYAGPGRTAHTRSYEWPHALSEIIGSLLGAGLRLERFDEGRTLPWRFSPLMHEVGGSFEFGPQWRDKVPCTFTIVASRP